MDPIHMEPGANPGLMDVGGEASDFRARIMRQVCQRYQPWCPYIRFTQSIYIPQHRLVIRRILWLFSTQTQVWTMFFSGRTGTIEKKQVFYDNFWELYQSASIKVIPCLKAYLLISYREHSPEFKLIASICRSPLSSTFPQRNYAEIISYEMRAIFCIKSCGRDLI